MDKNLFSGLEDLGFDNTEKLDIYDKKPDLKNSKDSKQEVKTEKKEDERNYLYDKEVTCPVCGNIFKAKSVKTSAYRRLNQESDFYINYALINPYFYDVWLCNVCGYAAMKSDFDKIRSSQIELVQQKIAPKWHGKKYPELYDVNAAIERYKISLLNYVIIDAKASKKAYTCLKIAWMYRLSGDETNEQIFLKQALDGFSNAYYNEDFPIYGMDKFMIMYLLAELNRRIKNFDEANLWFSNVLTSPGGNQKIKDLAREMKDLIKAETSTVKQEEPENAADTAQKKEGFFSKFLNRNKDAK